MSIGTSTFEDVKETNPKRRILTSLYGKKHGEVNTIEEDAYRPFLVVVLLTNC